MGEAIWKVRGAGGDKRKSETRARGARHNGPYKSSVARTGQWPLSGYYPLAGCFERANNDALSLLLLSSIYLSPLLSFSLCLSVSPSLFLVSFLISLYRDDRPSVDSLGAFHTTVPPTTAAAAAFFQRPFKINSGVVIGVNLRHAAYCSAWRLTNRQDR